MIRINELILSLQSTRLTVFTELSVTVDTDVVLGKGRLSDNSCRQDSGAFFCIVDTSASNTDTYLITIDGVDSDVKAAGIYRSHTLCRSVDYSDDPDSDGEDGEDSQGFYASMIIGSELLDTVGGLVGTVG